MTTEDPIAEARRLLAAAETMGAAIMVPTSVLALLQALCDRLEAAERRVTAMQGSLEAAACDFEGAETDMRCVIDFIDRDGRLDKALSHARAAIYDYEDARKACRKAAE